MQSSSLVDVETFKLFAWAADHAIPRWLSDGVVAEGGGFIEQLSDQGCALQLPLRTRLIGRQLFVFATAAKLGICTEQCTIAVEQGLEFLLRHGIGTDGIAYKVIASDGKLIDPRYDLYDQAFVLLGLAAAATVSVRTDKIRKVAERLVVSIMSNYRARAGGFICQTNPPTILLSNPHMHLLEASLYWSEVDPSSDAWSRISGEIADLAIRSFRHSPSGPVLEHFDENWRPTQSTFSLVEPGHQYEWAWLLLRHAEISGRFEFIDAAIALADFARKFGVDRTRCVVVNSVNFDGRKLQMEARLWPQTERIKAEAYLMLMDVKHSLFSPSHEIISSVRSLFRYFVPYSSGLWRDTMHEDGAFDTAPAKASSLYHIICALEFLTARVIRGRLIFPNSVTPFL